MVITPPPSRTRRSRLPLRRLVGPLMCLAGAMLLVPAGGCSSTEKTDDRPRNQKEPPEGYDTWDEYWADKDAEYRDFERDVQIQRMQRVAPPGGR